MIRSCCLSRKELSDMIRKAPKTKDGFYFFPRFRVLILLEGDIKDTGFFYDRIMFKDKICFDETDLKMLNAKKKPAIDADLRRIIDMKLNEVLKGLEFLHIKDRIPGTDYTLEELIDNTVYLVKYKYS